MMVHINLPILSFNQEPLHNILFSNTIYLDYNNNTSEFSNLEYMYNYNSSNIYLYNYDLRGKNIVFNTNDRLADRFYFYIKDNSCIREIYMKVFSDNNEYNVNYFINITNKVYLYTELKYKQDENEYLVYGCNFNELFKENFSSNGNTISRIIIKIYLDYNDIQLSQSIYIRENYTEGCLNDWKKENNNIIPNKSIEYLSSTEYDISYIFWSAFTTVIETPGHLPLLTPDLLFHMYAHGEDQLASFLR